MNNVCLVGRLTRDPELRTTSSGIATCTFSLAVDGRVNAQGEKTTDFINIVVWRNQAENLCKFCSKGSMVAVVGRISSRSYDAQDGSKRYVTEVVADNVRFLSSKNSASSSDYVDNAPDYSMGEPSQTTDLDNDPFKDFGSEVVLSDDDLPF